MTNDNERERIEKKIQSIISEYFVYDDSLHKIAELFLSEISKAEKRVRKKTAEKIKQTMNNWTCNDGLNCKHTADYSCSICICDKIIKENSEEK